MHGQIVEKGSGVGSKGGWTHPFRGGGGTLARIKEKGCQQSNGKENE